jgi:selenocysteine-specific elongation factor
VPGDRYVLRESGRAETVGGGEVLDVAPVLPAARAHPDRDVWRVVGERGPVDVAELEALTGVAVEPTAGRWAIHPTALAAMTAQLTEALAAGIDVARLGDPERAVLAQLDGVDVRDGVARRAGTVDTLAEHPFVHALAAGGAHPPDPAGVPRPEIRELVRRGLVVERDGICFHAAAIDDAAHLAARLLATDPHGFTTAQFREAIGTTRKYVIPLLTELDARGVTRRRGDLRIAGPRLPPAARGA